jgi:hypothetical protein
MTGESEIKKNQKSSDRRGSRAGPELTVRAPYLPDPDSDSGKLCGSIFCRREAWGDGYGRRQV